MKFMCKYKINLCELVIYPLPCLKTLTPYNLIYLDRFCGGHHSGNLKYPFLSVFTLVLLMQLTTL